MAVLLVAWCAAVSVASGRGVAVASGRVQLRVVHRHVSRASWLTMSDGDDMGTEEDTTPAEPPEPEPKVARSSFAMDAPPREMPPAESQFETQLKNTIRTFGSWSDEPFLLSVIKTASWLGIAALVGWEVYLHTVFTPPPGAGL